jgi:hypothetical protein
LAWEGDYGQLGLDNKIDNFVPHCNRKRRPFIRIATADSILQKLATLFTYVRDSTLADQNRRKDMTGSNLRKFRVAAVLCFLVLILNSLALAENVKIEGLIVGRSGDEIIVKFGSGAELAFQLTDRTKVSDIGELHTPWRKQLAMAALIPGLKVKVEGVYSETRQVLATSIKFKGGDLEDAKKIQAGMHELKVQTEQHQEELDRQNAEHLGRTYSLFCQWSGQS